MFLIKHFLFTYYFFIKHMYVYMCVHLQAGTDGDQKRILCPLAMELQALREPPDVGGAFSLLSATSSEPPLTEG